MEACRNWPSLVGTLENAIPNDPESGTRLKQILADCDPFIVNWDQADPNALSWRLREGATGWKAYFVIDFGRYGEMENPQGLNNFPPGTVRIITKESTPGVALLLQGTKEALDANGNPVPVDYITLSYTVSIGAD